MGAEAAHSHLVGRLPHDTPDTGGRIVHRAGQQPGHLEKISPSGCQRSLKRGRLQSSRRILPPGISLLASTSSPRWRRTANQGAAAKGGH